MKDNTKRNRKPILIISAVITLILGAALVGVAAISGGLTREAWAKADAKTRAAKGYYETPKEISLTYEADEFKTVNFDLKSDSLKIVKGSGDKFGLNYFEDYENEYTVVAEGGALTFKENAEPEKVVKQIFYPDFSWVLGIFDGFESSDIVLTVPQDFIFENIIAKNSSGRIEMEGLTATGTIEAVLSSGNIKIENCNAETADIKLSSGKAQLEKCDIKTVELAFGSGNAELVKCNIDTADIEFSSGSAKLDDCNINAAKVVFSSGGVKFDGCDVKTTDINFSSGSAVFKDLPGGFTSAVTSFNIKATSGSVRIDGQGRGNQYTATIASPAYSIKVQLSSGSFKFN